jgi:hypothetical protein
VAPAGPSQPAPAKPVVSRSVAASGKPAPIRVGAARDHGRSESPWDGDDAVEASRPAPEPAPKGFARPLMPPVGARVRRVVTPVPLRISSSKLQPPTDPEIETYLEIEADLPPERGAVSDLESELALSLALPRDPDDEHEEMSITFEDDGHRVIETTTESDGLTLTVTVTEPFADLDDRQRAITAEDGAEVSGTISIPEDTPPAGRRRAKRHSEGWDP